MHVGLGRGRIYYLVLIWTCLWFSVQHGMRLLFPIVISRGRAFKADGIVARSVIRLSHDFFTGGHWRRRKVRAKQCRMHCNPDVAVWYFAVKKTATRQHQCMCRCLKIAEGLWRQTHRRAPGYLAATATSWGLLFVPGQEAGKRRVQLDAHRRRLCVDGIHKYSCPKYVVATFAVAPAVSIAIATPELTYYAVCTLAAPVAPAAADAKISITSKVNSSSNSNSAAASTFFSTELSAAACPIVTILPKAPATAGFRSSNDIASRRDYTVDASQ